MVEEMSLINALLQVKTKYYEGKATKEEVKNAQDALLSFLSK